jgi:putative membrane protein
VQHYLRGEDGIYYKDLYHLVKFLPTYALPASIPSTTNLHGIGASATPTRGGFTAHPPDGLSITITRTPDAPALTAFAHPAVPGTLSPLDGLHTGSAELFKRAPSSQKGTGDRITLSVPTTPASPRKARPGSGGGGATPLKDVGERLPRPVLTSLAPPLAPPLRTRAGPSATPLSPLPRGARPAVDPELDIEALGGLAPAHNPPAWAAFDVFPLSLLVKPGARLGKEIKGRKAMRARAKLRGENEAHNIPLEISLYLVREGAHG